MLPSEILARVFKERDYLGLQMTLSGRKRIVYFDIQTVEGPNDLNHFSLGAASPQNVTGTDWNEIQDSSSRYYLEPGSEKVIYHFFFGVSPGQAWIYRRYPSNTDLNSLIATRAIGDPVGYIDGIKSPYRSPSVQSEMFSMKGMHPAFLGYHPYKEPTSITVRLNFYIMRYDVEVLGWDDTGDKKGLIAPPNVRNMARVRPVGGRNPVDMPTWVETRIGG